MPRTAVQRSLTPSLLTLALAAPLLGPATVAADNLTIERSDPSKSFRFSRGASPVPIAVTLRYKVEAADGDEIAFAVHDQKNRPLMTHPMPVAKVIQGQDSIIFKTTIKTLESDAKSVVVEAVLLKALRRGRQPRHGEHWRVKLTYKVK